MKPIVHFTVWLSAGALCTACDAKSTQWRLDSDYSMNLSVLAPNEQISALAATVDEIRVFHDFSDVDTIIDTSSIESRTPQLVHTDRQSIDAFISSIRQLVEPSSGVFVVPGCSERKTRDLWHVLFLDRDLGRIGYVLVRRCEGDDSKEYALIKAYQGSDLAASVYYNEELLPMLADKSK